MKDSKKLFGDYELSFKGKVRDIYNINDNRLLIVTTDRISAFDYVFEDIIPGKGILLTKMTKFWFKLTNQIITNHLLDKNEIKNLNISNEATNRCMLVKKTKVLPIEAIVRGHLAGSAWESYEKKNIINNEITNKIYKKYQKFDQAIFTPSTKANVGEKDQNISFDEMKDIIGESLSVKIKETSLKLYEFAYKYAENKGIIIADTKFEFGLDENGDLVLIDEIFTPDCSRFWLYDNKEKEINYDSFDKQFFRNYLINMKWNNNQINIPEDIKQKLIQRYQLAYNLITS
jgi:phosphoribosylaminoimidazole-succinocarboxamide synthase